MPIRSNSSGFITTAYTLVVGAIGAGLAYSLSLPVYILTGPAILVSIIGLFGLKLAISDLFRDASFLLIGIGIGAGVNSDATAAFLRWPIAFAALAVMLLAVLFFSRFILTRFFGFDPRSAVLAASPGHLSFVISYSTDLNLDTAKISVVQSIRLLALTLVVPFVAIAFGIEISGNIMPAGDTISNIHLLALIAVSFLLGLVFKYLRIPAALLMAGMATSSLTHVTDLTPGVLTPSIALVCFMIMGTLIGTRFSGITLLQLRAALFSGLTTTTIAAGFAILAAIPIALFLNIPTAHVIVAFAPGGLETMIAMGSVLGAAPGFIAACHFGRLMMLTFLVPFMLGLKTSQPTQ